LLHDQFASALDEASARFDYVIIDSPPILAVTDAAVIGRVAGAALLVVEADVHPLREIEQSVKRLRQTGVNLVGAVFNGMETSRKGYGYGQYYGYGYSYTSKAS
jgi:tyrosine-protein kinase Etk/Wzc